VVERFNYYKKGDLKISGTIFIKELYNFNFGCGWSPLLLQNCMPTVFELDN